MTNGLKLASIIKYQLVSSQMDCATVFLGPIKRPIHLSAFCCFRIVLIQKIRLKCKRTHSMFNNFINTAKGCTVLLKICHLTDRRYSYLVVTQFLTEVYLPMISSKASFILQQRLLLKQRGILSAPVYSSTIFVPSFTDFSNRKIRYCS